MNGTKHKRWNPVQLHVADDMMTVEEQMREIGRPVRAERAVVFDACARALLLLEGEGLIDRQQFIVLRGKLSSRVDMHSSGLNITGIPRGR